MSWARLGCYLGVHTDVTALINNLVDTHANAFDLCVCLGCYLGVNTAVIALVDTLVNTHVNTHVMLQ